MKKENNIFKNEKHDIERKLDTLKHEFDIVTLDNDNYRFYILNLKH